MPYNINCDLTLFNNSILKQKDVACFSFFRRLTAEEINNIKVVDILMMNSYANNDFYKHAIKNSQIIKVWLSLISDIFNLKQLGISLSYKNLGVNEKRNYYAKYSIKLEQKIKCKNHKIFWLCLCSYIRMAIENKNNQDFVIDICKYYKAHPEADSLETLYEFLFKHRNAGVDGHGIWDTSTRLRLDTNSAHVAKRLLNENYAITDILCGNHTKTDEVQDRSYWLANNKASTWSAKYTKEFLNILKNTNENLSRRISVISELSEMDSKN